MAHQKETPTEGGVPPEIEKAGRDLGQAIIDAMLAWADENGNVVDTRVPLIGLHIAVQRCFNAIAPEKRRGYAEDLSRAIFKSAGGGPS